MELTELFWNVDDFCQEYEQLFASFRILPDGNKKLTRSCSLSLSEVMTIVIYFHLSGYRTFKDYYTKYVINELNGDFPHLVSYNRMVELMPTVFIPCLYYLKIIKGNRLELVLLIVPVFRSVTQKELDGTRCLKT